MLIKYTFSFPTSSIIPISCDMYVATKMTQFRLNCSVLLICVVSLSENLRSSWRKSMNGYLICPRIRTDLLVCIAYFHLNSVVPGCLLTTSLNQGEIDRTMKYIFYLFFLNFQEMQRGVLLSYCRKRKGTLIFLSFFLVFFFPCFGAI